MKIILGQEYTWKPTTDEFGARVVRRLEPHEVDEIEVGRMYEIVVQAFDDELSPATTTYEGLLNEIADILYPLDGYRDDQWNGGDVCDALAMLLDKYMPDARDRQPERDDTIPTCDICGQTEEESPLTWDGEAGLHVFCQRSHEPCSNCGGRGASGAPWDPDTCARCRGTGWAPRKGFEEYEAERRRLGL